jgi:hypothetical protein
MLDNPKSGYNSASEFQSSALPWVTSSVAQASTTHRIDLPKVSRFISMFNHGTAGQNIRIGFTKNGTENGNYFRVDGGSLSPTTFELRVKTLFIRSDSGAAPPFDLLVGLTNVDANNMPLLSGTLSDGSPGWTGIG